MSISVFLDTAPAGMKPALQVLAAAESLTDRIAADLYNLNKIPGVSAERFLLALHQSDLIEPRNSEWSFAPTTREHLRNLASVDLDTLRQAHSRLLKIGFEASPVDAGSIVPSYLMTSAGKAYHSAYAGRVVEAMAFYFEAAEATISDHGGIQWLASRFASEQMDARILPLDSTELLFLRAMSLFRDGAREAAYPLFERIIEKNEANKFNAVSCDIVGVGLRKQDRAKAERLFRRAIEIVQELGDQAALGVHTHNLAQILRKRDRAEAERLFRQSLQIANEQGDLYSQAIRKNGLADLLAHIGSRHHAEAERLLREAMSYFERNADEVGTGAPMTTLARLVAMNHDRYYEAEALYRRAIAIARKYHDHIGLSIRLSGLVKLLMLKPEGLVEAATLLRENLELVRRLKQQATRVSLSQLLSVIESKLAELEEL